MDSQQAFSVQVIGRTEDGDRIHIKSEPAPNFFLRRLMDGATHDDTGLVFIPSSQHDGVDVELAFDSSVADHLRDPLANDWLGRVYQHWLELDDDQRKQVFAIDPPRPGGIFADSGTGLTSGHSEPASYNI